MRIPAVQPACKGAIASTVYDRPSYCRNTTADYYVNNPYHCDIPVNSYNCRCASKEEDSCTCVLCML